jgi:hypothetical protein
VIDKILAHTERRIVELEDEQVFLNERLCDLTKMQAAWEKKRQELLGENQEQLP